MAGKTNYFEGMADNSQFFNIDAFDTDSAQNTSVNKDGKIELDKERYKKAFVSLSDIIPNPDNRFSVKKDASYYELLSNIQKNGFDPSQALKVKPKNGDGKFMLLSGERRWTAANEANLAEVPVVIDKNASNFTKSEEIITIFRDNDGYRDKNIYNSVAQIKILVAALKAEGMAQSDIKTLLIEQLDRSQRSIEDYLRLMDLPDGLIDMGKDEALFTADDGKKILEAISKGADGDALLSTLSSIASETSDYAEARKKAKDVIEKFCKIKHTEPKKEKKSEDPIKLVTKLQKSLSAATPEKLYRIHDEKRRSEFKTLISTVKQQLQELEEWFNEE